ncbi:MAG: hypothetical protein HGA45_38300 [Chloroflexales bacterium]|nr:hypothetical protein [Chloroflexales bacterium]
MLFELLMAVFMERRTTKDSSNSSKSSSQTHGDDTAAGRPGAKGKGKAQNNARSSNTRTLETVQVAGPPRVIPLGKIQNPVAEAPGDADFTNAAIWRNDRGDPLSPIRPPTT